MWSNIHYICSQVREVGFYPTSNSGTSQSERVKLKIILERACYKGSLTEFYQSFPFGTMLQHSQSQTQSVKKHSTLGKEYPVNSPSVAGSRRNLARTFHAQEKAQESTERSRPCGHTWQESLVRYDLATSSWKTHQCLWEEDLPESSVILPKWGLMTASGELYQRETPVHRTKGTESGLKQNWPTCQARDWKGSSGRSLKGTECDLPTAVKKWSTPTCADAGAGAVLNETTDIRRNKNGSLRKYSNNGVGGSLGLARQVAMESFPTPTANEDAAGTPKGNMQKMLGNDPRVRGVTSDEWNKGALNPDWVEWLMGWPIGWSDLEPISKESFNEWLSQSESEWWSNEKGIPRVTKRKQYRVPRLKAIGNGQVPACASLAWKTLTENT